MTPANWDLSKLIPPQTAASKRGEHNDRSCESSNRDISICGWQWVSAEHVFLTSHLIHFKQIIIIDCHNLPYDIIFFQMCLEIFMFQGLCDSLSLCVTAAFEKKSAKSATVTIQAISLQGITLNTHIYTSRLHLQSITYKKIQFTHLPAPMWLSHGGSSKLPCLGLHILLVIPRVEGITLQQRCCLCHGRRT